jgi:hypothetical protein
MRTNLKYSYILLPAMLALLIAGCERYEEVIPDPEREAFNFIVTESQREYINASRGEQYEVTDPIPVLEYAGEEYAIDRFEIRGDNTLNFERKGFGLNMDRKLTLPLPDGSGTRKYEEFKLLAMVYDYTYIENSVANGLFREAGLWPVLSFFTEVRLNGHTQGLYHFIEDPFEYFIERANSSFVIRRGYDHVIKASSANPAKEAETDSYKSRFRNIYTTLPLWSGKQLYDTLSDYLDLDQYFSKIAVDLLIRNGDYTDEVIFYTKLTEDREVFGVFPWDLDDIFALQPHEIDNPWGTGTVFGTREYYSMEDVYADVGVKLIFSIEDDLDYKIASDDFLYGKYLETLAYVIEKIDASVIDRVFDYTRDHIGPFYGVDSIIGQSVHDEAETSYALFNSNLEEKRQMIKERRDWIAGELRKQKGIDK